MKPLIKCPNCSKYYATVHPTMGVLPCARCQYKRSKNSMPRQFEVITENLRQERKEHAKSIIQPFRNGVFSEEYYQTYGTKGVSVSKEDIKNKKPVWRDINSENFDYSKSK